MSVSGNRAYAKSNVLITGGTGSIGTELLRSLLKNGARHVRILSNDENGLFESSNDYENDSRVEFRFGDVRDTRSLDEAVCGVDLVFHAAALKHVTFCETNPYEAITTNTVGTQNLIDQCVKHSVSKFVLISTDKAVNPINTMGATKLLAEKLVLSASRRNAKTTFSMVRFGNVLGSRGSVVIIFERQVREGGPITVTNPAMTRFIMSTSEASELILRASEQSMTGETFVLKMRAVRIGELAEASRRFFCRRLGKDPARVEIKVTGAQPGEKMHEELMNEVEAKTAMDAGFFYIINPSRKRKTASRNRGLKGALVSDSLPHLGVKEIVSELEKLYRP